MGGRDGLASSRTPVISTPSQQRKRHLPRLSLRRLFHGHRGKKGPSRHHGDGGGGADTLDSRSDTAMLPPRTPAARAVAATTPASHAVTTTTTKQASLAEPEDLDSVGGEEEEEEVEVEEEEREREEDDGSLLECPLCFVEQPRPHFPDIGTCEHRSCRSCLQQYLHIEITEARVNIRCPECAERLHPADIRSILAGTVGDLMTKFEDFTLRRFLITDPDTRYCPAADCRYAVIATGCASCPRITCQRPGCDTDFCYHCKAAWHPNQTCDTARALRASSIIALSGPFTFAHECSMLIREEIKPCPRCMSLITKMDDGSCNHMTCSVCSTEFCWLCMNEISDLHYLSPSGCTFWGKKPWSRKKKIFWQLGTIVGAPVGIALIASVSVPAIIIGVPVWVGRKIYAKFQHVSKHRRNIYITSGVTASVLISPMLAGLAVGIGVPILLAYVYGVVPFSLCRSRGCGPTTSLEEGTCIEFDDDNEGTIGTFVLSENSSVLPHSVTNPSIGEMSVMTCTSASSGHLDRFSRKGEVERDSASNMALAAENALVCLPGSTFTAHGPNDKFLNKLEVQAEVLPPGVRSGVNGGESASAGSNVHKVPASCHYVMRFDKDCSGKSGCVAMEVSVPMEVMPAADTAGSHHRRAGSPASVYSTRSYELCERRRPPTTSVSVGECMSSHADDDDDDDGDGGGGTRRRLRASRSDTDGTWRAVADGNHLSRWSLQHGRRAGGAPSRADAEKPLGEGGGTPAARRAAAVAAVAKRQSSHGSRERNLGRALAKQQGSKQKKS